MTRYVPCPEVGCSLDAEVVDAWVWEHHVAHGGSRLETHVATECPLKHRLFGVRVDASILRD